VFDVGYGSSRGVKQVVVGVDEYVYAMSCLRTRLEGTDDMHDWGMPASSRRSSMIRTSADRRWLVLAPRFAQRQ
jgi:hypothetical protein